jgi:hypothetical protein
MRRGSLLVLAIGLAALAAPAAARADQIGYGYDFLTPAAVTGDQGNLGAVSFATTNPGTATGHAVVTATQLAVVTSAPSDNPDTFSGQTYSLTMHLTDDPSGKSGTLTFTGTLTGSLSVQNVNIRTSFSPATKTLVLGNDTYTVSLGSTTLGPDPTSVTALSATIDVRAIEITSQAPEPSALVLTVLGLTTVLARRRRGEKI